jgi:hypothetical protein
MSTRPTSSIVCYHNDRRAPHHVVCSRLVETWGWNRPHSIH